jgi:hypothetical protein
MFTAAARAEMLPTTTTSQAQNRIDAIVVVVSDPYWRIM